MLFTNEPVYNDPRVRQGELPDASTAHGMSMGSTKENDRRPSTVKFTNLMPGQSGPKTTLWQLFRKWPRLSLWAVGLAITIILYGYDTVIVGNITSMPEFQ